MERHSRRQFLQGSLAVAALGLASCGVPFGPSADRPRLYRVGCLLPVTREAGANLLEAFRQGLREHGYVEGESVALEIRYSEGIAERLSDLASELVRLNPDVIVTGSAGAVHAARQSTTSIPIVFGTLNDPVAEGVVASLARPGGNATGLTLSAGTENAKRLELLKEAVPSLSRAAVLWNQSTVSAFKEIELGANTLGVQILSVELESPDGLQAALAAVTAGHADGLLLTNASLLVTLAPLIVEFAAQNRLPAMYTSLIYVREGGLMVYGPNIAENYRRAAAYVDKIFKGASPADLPVERPTKFEFIINLRTAQALGLTIPQSVLAQATEIIQ